LFSTTYCRIFSLNIPYLGDVEMASDAARKTYWDLLETLRWICTRNEKLVAAMRDRSDDDRMAVTLSLVPGDFYINGELDIVVKFAVDSLLEESGFEPSVPLGEKRSFRNASIRELHRAAYRGGRKRYRRGRPSGSRRSDHSNTATASELQVRPVG